MCAVFMHVLSTYFVENLCVSLTVMFSDADICSSLVCLQTSQDKSIVVWEIRTQSVVARLQGHSGTVVSFLHHLQVSCTACDWLQHQALEAKWRSCQTRPCEET